MSDVHEPVETELTPRIGRTATRVLAIEGFTRYEQLAMVSAAQLLALHGIGPKSIRILREELAARGLGFAERQGPARHGRTPPD